MALSMAFRTPTPLKSTDLQCGQCAENTVTLASFLDGGLRRATGTSGLAIAEGRCGTARRAIALAASGRTACFAGSLNLLFGPQVRLGKSYPFFCAGDLALMSFCKSFVHC